MRHIIASLDAQDWKPQARPFSHYVPEQGTVSHRIGLLLRDVERLQFDDKGQLVEGTFNIIQQGAHHVVFPRLPRTTLEDSNSLLLFSGADSLKSWVRSADAAVRGLGYKPGRVISSAVWGNAQENRCATICLLRPGEAVGYETTGEDIPGVWESIHCWDGTNYSFYAGIQKA